MMQVLAILHDSLNELRSKSLFWIALVISVLVPALLFGLIGFDENGWHILWFSTQESDVLREGTPAKRDLLAWLFGGALLWWWLTWAAIMIALIVSSSTIPEFISGGAIDLVLAKPIPRAKLYLVKIMGALLFTVLQVTVSVAVAYLLAGLRFGLWFHQAWLAVPLVTLQFFYLFVVMSFVGLVTRSTLASLLAALVFWGLVSLIQFASNQVDSQLAQSQLAIEQAERRVTAIRAKAQEEGREPTAPEEARIRRAESHAEPMRTLHRSLLPWRRPVNTIELFVPKTGDIQKIIAEKMNAPTFSELVMRLQGFDPEAMARLAGMDDGEQFRDAQKAGIAGERAARTVKPLVSIGMSLAFTAVVLGLSLVIFSRRDF